MDADVRLNIAYSHFSLAGKSLLYLRTNHLSFFGAELDCLFAGLKSIRCNAGNATKGKKCPKTVKIADRGRHALCCHQK